VACRQMSFREYIATRRYQFGRGSNEGWAFVARALGDAAFPDVGSWTELRAYLEACGDDLASIDAARVVWNSYLSLLTKLRRTAPANLEPGWFSDGSKRACGLAP
jgi:hypothetical protein